MTKLLKKEIKPSYSKRLVSFISYIVKSETITDNEKSTFEALCLSLEHIITQDNKCQAHSRILREMIDFEIHCSKNKHRRK